MEKITVGLYLIRIDRYYHCTGCMYHSTSWNFPVPTNQYLNLKEARGLRTYRPVVILYRWNCYQPLFCPYEGSE